VRIVLRFLLWIFAILVLALAISIWWYVYRPLPQLDGTASLPGLQQSVSVERDNWGVPHIRASTLEDLVEAQGYVVAQDRLWQLDLLRRAARGQLSEILGPATIDIDKDFRTLNFSRAAQRDLALLDPANRKLMEAYARGVNHFIEQHSTRLPIEFTLLNYKPQPWQPTDTLVITGYMYRTLTDTREEEIRRAIVSARAGPELARDLFSQEAAMDHFVVGDPNADRNLHDPHKADADDEDDDEMDVDDVLKAGYEFHPRPVAATAP
jgi:penicillin amidase